MRCWYCRASRCFNCGHANEAGSELRTWEAAKDARHPNDRLHASRHLDIGHPF
jgi:hypothetical protein